MVIEQTKLLKTLLVMGVLSLSLSASSVGRVTEYQTLFHESQAKTNDKIKPIIWPDLPESGFISGQTADRAHVQAGKAVFVLELDGVPASKPVDIIIPQYAYHVDEETGLKNPCIVIQAEALREVNSVG